MSAYYNEIDSHAAQWLRNLIARGLIAPGIVDERSILDVTPRELAGYTQCHFFAGIGGWAYALRLAGWPSDRPVWTGSCPCQPFSAAGKGAGFADERHLWPAFDWLISQQRPDVVIGEQVASKDGLSWLDLVQTDLEGKGYASWAVDLCAAGVGAPHIRQRLYWGAVDDANNKGLEGRRLSAQRPGEQPAGARGMGCRLANGESLGRSGRQDDGDEGRRQCASGQGRAAGGLEHGTSDGRVEWRPESSEWRPVPGCGVGGVADAGSGEHSAFSTWAAQRRLSPRHGGDQERAATGPVNGLWRDADWLFCTDGKWRPVESESFPLVDGPAFRVGSGRPSFAGKSRAKMLKGYGNALNAYQAKVFIESTMEMLEDSP